MNLPERPALYDACTETAPLLWGKYSLLRELLDPSQEAKYQILGGFIKTSGVHF